MIEIKSNEKLQKELTGFKPVTDANGNRVLYAQTINVGTEEELWKAWYKVRHSVLMGKVIIQIADGTYNMRGTLSLNDFLYSQRFQVKGNLTDPSKVVLKFPHGKSGISLVGCSGDILYMGGFTIEQEAATNGDTATKHGYGLQIQRGTKFYTYRRTDLSEAPSIFIKNFNTGLYATNHAHVLVARLDIEDCYYGIVCNYHSQINCQYTKMTGSGKRLEAFPDRYTGYNYTNGWGIQANYNSVIHGQYCDISNFYGGVLAQRNSNINVNNSYDKNHPNYSRENGPTKMKISATTAFYAAYNSFVYANGNIDVELKYRTVLRTNDVNYKSRTECHLSIAYYSSTIYINKYAREININGIYTAQNSYCTVTVNKDEHGDRGVYLLRAERDSYVYGNYIECSDISTLIRSYDNSFVEGYKIKATSMNYPSHGCYTSYQGSTLRAIRCDIDNTIGKGLSYNDNSNSLIYKCNNNIVAGSRSTFETHNGGYTRKYGGNYTGETITFSPVVNTFGNKNGFNAE